MHLNCRYLLLLALVLGTACRQPYHLSRPPAAQLKQVSAYVPADTAFERIIAPYKASLDSKMNEVIGYAPAELTKKEWESTLGNFVVDLMLTQARLYTQEPVHVSVTTNGGLRNPIPKGDITVGHVYELMPFENELVLAKVRGSSLQQLFDLAASKRTVPIGNATFTVTGGRAFDIRIGEQPLQPDRIYTVAVSDYLANGGDNMMFFQEGENAQILGITVRDAILNHIRSLTAAGKPVTATLDGRVQVGE